MTTKYNKNIEERITMEIVVDAYDQEERAMGWYYYLQDILKFPFIGKCVAKRSISPLKPNQKFTVIGIAEIEECMHEIFVEIELSDDENLCVPLSQVAVVSKNQSTKIAVKDWHYWVNKGYQY